MTCGWTPQPRCRRGNKRGFYMWIRIVEMDRIQMRWASMATLKATDVLQTMPEAFSTAEMIDAVNNMLAVYQQSCEALTWKPSRPEGPVLLELAVADLLSVSVTRDVDVLSLLSDMLATKYRQCVREFYTILTRTGYHFCHQRWQHVLQDRVFMLTYMFQRHPEFHMETLQLELRPDHNADRQCILHIQDKIVPHTPKHVYVALPESLAYHVFECRRTMSAFVHGLGVIMGQNAVMCAFLKTPWMQQAVSVVGLAEHVNLYKADLEPVYTECVSASGLHLDQYTAFGDWLELHMKKSQVQQAVNALQMRPHEFCETSPRQRRCRHVLYLDVPVDPDGYDPVGPVLCNGSQTQVHTSFTVDRLYDVVICRHADVPLHVVREDGFIVLTEPVMWSAPMGVHDLGKYTFWLNEAFVSCRVFSPRATRHPTAPLISTVTSAGARHVMHFCANDDTAAMSTPIMMDAFFTLFGKDTAFVNYFVGDSLVENKLLRHFNADVTAVDFVTQLGNVKVDGIILEACPIFIISKQMIENVTTLLNAGGYFIVHVPVEKISRTNWNVITNPVGELRFVTSINVFWYTKVQTMTVFQRTINLQSTFM